MQLNLRESLLQLVDIIGDNSTYISYLCKRKSRSELRGKFKVLLVLM